MRAGAVVEHEHGRSLRVPAELLAHNAGQAIDAARKTIVEPVFAQIRGARSLDRFRLRGLEKGNGEWALMATTQHLLKLFRVSLATA